MRADLEIAHLYPDVLRTYGDRGNVLAMSRRAEWRGFSTSVTQVSRDEPLGRADFIFIGGGADRAQEAVAADLGRRGSELRDAVAAGSVLLGVCAGYQLLGLSYSPAGGPQIDGLGMLDVATVADKGRCVGNIRVAAKLDGLSFELVGFENHSGRTTVGAGASPLGEVLSGYGNNGLDGGEGAIQGNVIGTYLHGPILPSNPDFADALLARSLHRVTDGEPLLPIAERDRVGGSDLRSAR